MCYLILVMITLLVMMFAFFHLLTERLSRFLLRCLSRAQLGTQVIQIFFSDSSLLVSANDVVVGCVVRF